jgi:hypothetical protein
MATKYSIVAVSRNDRQLPPARTFSLKSVSLKAPFSIDNPHSLAQRTPMGHLHGLEAVAVGEKQYTPR